MKKYYSESPVKNSIYRRDYLNGINTFLENTREKKNLQRTEFITPLSYSQNQTGYRKKLCELLGFPLNEPQITPTLLEKQFVAEDGNVKIYRLQLLYWNSIPLYGLYFEQIENSIECPFVIAQHGGLGTSELCSSFYSESENYNHLVRRITDRGANVFAPQLLLWDKDIYGTEYDRFRIDGKLRQLGGSITALELYMLRGSIDYFINHEAICHSKIGIAGLSYGGMYALHLAAIDTRIRACYSCSWGHDIFDFSSPDRSYLNAQSCFSSAEVAALIAPRALTMAMGDRDELFPVKQTQETFAQILPYYKIFNCEDLFLPIVFHGIHELDKQDIELKFLMDHL